MPGEKTRNRDRISLNGIGFLLALAAIILTGGGQPYLSWCIFIALTGFFLLIQPPKKRVAKYIDWSVLILLGIIVVQFIPLPGFLHASWWDDIRNQGWPLSHATAIQPTVQFEALISCLAGVAWIYIASNYIHRSVRKKPILLLLLGLICLLAIGFIIGNFLGYKYPFAPKSESFTYFPNRNQSVLLFVVGGVLSLGFFLESLSRKSAVSIVFIIIYAIMTAAILMGIARSGIVLLFLGSAFIFAIMAPRLRSFVNTSIIIGGIVAITVLGSLERFEVIERIHQLLNFKAGSIGARAQIYPDVFSMLFDNGITGIGLGNFPFIFPQYYQHFSGSEYIAIHPESDWLWLASELGFLGVGFLIFAVYSLYKHVIASEKWKRRRSTELIAIAALAVILLHSLVDVPLHRPGIVMVASLLLVLAIPRHQQHHFSSKYNMPIRALGILLLCFFSYHMFHYIEDKDISPKTLESKGLTIAGDLLKERELDKLNNYTDRWLDKVPLSWKANFHRGNYSVAQFQLDEGERHLDFAMFLTPYKYDIRYSIGLMWRNLAPEKIPDLWASCLLKCPTPAYEPTKYQNQFYYKMLEASWKDTSLVPLLDQTTLNIRDTIPRLRALFLRQLKDPILAAKLIDEELVNQIQTKVHSLEDVNLILKRLTAIDSIETAKSFFNKYPDSKIEYFSAYAHMLYHDQQAAKACSFLINKFNNPDLINLPELRTASQLQEHIANLKQNIDNELWAKALREMDAIERSLSTTPNYLVYWRAVAHFQMDDYPKSWKWLQAYEKLIQNN